MPHRKQERHLQTELITTRTMPDSTTAHQTRTSGVGWLSRPAIVFSAAWISCAALTTLPVTELFAVYAQEASVIALVLIVSHLAGAASVARFPVRAPHRAQSFTGSRKFENRLLVIWALVSAVEIVHSGGIPILWLRTSPEKTYADFGIHSVHGAANGIWLYLCSVTCVRLATRTSTKGDWPKALILGAWPILMLSRALLTIVLATVVSYCAISSKKPRLTKVAVAVTLAAAFIWGFGLLGDVRSSEFSISSALGVQDSNLPTGILWVYAYAVSPIANLALNVSSAIPSYEFLPTNTLSPLLPSQARQAMGIDVGFNGYLGDLVHGAFNVSTAFSAPYHDWGWPGMVLMSSLLGAVGQRIWTTARMTGELSLLAGFNALIALSIFTNQFNQLPVVLFFVLVQMHPIGVTVARSRRTRRVKV